MEVEIWKDIDGFEGRYQISSLRRVKSLYYHNGMAGWIRRDKILAQHISKDGHYFVVNLRLNYKVHVKKIHKIYAIAFIPNPENKPFINHKDGNKLNNTDDNLEWCTSSENNQHAWDTGLKIKRFGADNHRCKFTHAQIEEIKNLLISGTPVKDIASSYHVTIGAIYPLKNKLKIAQCS